MESRCECMDIVAGREHSVFSGVCIGEGFFLSVGDANYFVIYEATGIMKCCYNCSANYRVVEIKIFRFFNWIINTLFMNAP